MIATIFANYGGFVIHNQYKIHEDFNTVRFHSALQLPLWQLSMAGQLYIT